VLAGSSCCGLSRAAALSAPHFPLGTLAG